MDCNKDEAIRAKELAQKKMQNNDFDGAEKIALKAQKLFPELENITHLLAVCQVHCSAQSRILGSEKDWYSILQVERSADEGTIKKQYRKLALLLHPDKNKFPGAEAAFKFIGEAHLVLSDRGRRSLYDAKLGISIKSAQAKPPHHQVKKNPSTWKQPGVQISVPNGFSTQFSDLNQHKTTQSNSSVSQESFWTCCPFCNIKYQYYRNFVNRALRCQKCSKPFIAYDIGAKGAPPGTKRSQDDSQGVPSRSKWSEPSVSHKTEFQVPGFRKTSTQTPAGDPASSSGSQMTSGSGTVGSDSGPQMRGTSEVGLNLKAQKTSSNMGSGVEGIATSKVESVKPREGPRVGSKKRKRGSKLEAECSEISDTSSDTDLADIIIDESVSKPAAGPNSGVNDIHDRRRSLRQKHQASYMESEGDDNDLESATKRPQDGNSSSDTKGQQEGVFDTDPHCANPLKQKGSVSSEVNSHEKKFQAHKNRGQEACAQYDREKVEIIDDDSETDANAMDDQCQVLNCPDPEFNDFDKGREEHSFAVDQCWACFDPVDGMPRFYAHIRKVYSSRFKVRITWLEPDPDEESEIDWVNEELPAACGKFRRGKSEDTTDHLTFSHQVLYEKGGKKGSFMIYPNKGEVWSLFKDWDIKWSTDPENHKNFKYEIVEVISDFVEGAGIKVAFLYKVRGFVSLFHRRNQKSESIVIPPNELYRFSHRIPSFKMSGAEKEGVPEGCFELDPASLPLNPEDLYSPFMAMDGAENKEKNQVNDSPLSTKMAATNHLNCRGGKSCSDSSPPKSEVTREVEEFNPQTNEPSPRTSKSSHPSFSPSHNVSLDLFYDFRSEKLEGKFEVGQIWALYKPDDKLPKMYGQIKKIGFNPFTLHVMLLEGCSLPKNGIKSSCGTFKLQNGRPSIFSPNSFSHMMDAKIINKSRLEIYPKVGQIWAMYWDWKADLSSSDMGNRQYEIVEIIERSNGCTKVSSLVLLNGYKSVFRSHRRNRSSIGTIEVQENELARFSHQIPAFQLTTEKGGSLRGCWELDPASVPSNLFPAR